MRKIKTGKIIILIAIIAILITPIIFFNRTLNKPLNIENDIIIKVEEGESFYSVLGDLSKENKIKGVPFIKAYLKITSKEIDVKPGEYKLHKDMSLNDIITTITSESVINLIKFTVPEGYTIDDIAEKLQQEGVCNKEDFIKVVKEHKVPSFIKVNRDKRYNLEGYLYPDTYILKRDDTPKIILDKMLNRFEEVWNEALDKTNMIVKPENVEKVITIASMIEKEARIDLERPIISSVIQNRIKSGMMLQIDATVIYALGTHVDKVLYSHLDIESPYNTYRNHGLPIGPISNPGLPSILAALEPEKTDYLFYVLQNNDKHYFTNNYDDFILKQKELGY
ncbi:endolytic transglycosylase MltG [Clostridium carnis]